MADLREDDVSYLRCLARVVGYRVRDGVAYLLIGEEEAEACLHCIQHELTEIADRLEQQDWEP